MINAYVNAIKSFISEKNKVFFVPGHHHAICTLDLTDYSVNIGEELTENEDKFPVDIFSLEDGTIYCAEVFGESAIVWKVGLRGDVYKYASELKCETVDSIMYGDKLFFFPRNVKEDLIVFSLATDGFEINCAWSDMAKMHELYGRVKRTYKEDNKIYFLFRDDKRVMEFDVKTCEFHELPLPADDYLDIVKCENCFYMIDENNNGQILYWNSITGEYGEWCKVCNTKIAKLLKCKEYVIADCRDSLVIVKNGIIVRNSIDLSSSKNGRCNYFSLLCKDDSIVLCPWGNEEFLFLDSEFNVEHREKYTISDDLVHAKDIFFENVDYDLCTYMDLVKRV